MSQIRSKNLREKNEKYYSEKKTALAKREKKMANQLSLKQHKMLVEKVKHFPVLYDKHVKGYKERDAVTMRGIK